MNCRLWDSTILLAILQSKSFTSGARQYRLIEASFFFRKCMATGKNITVWITFLFRLNPKYASFILSSPFPARGWRSVAGRMHGLTLGGQRLTTERSTARWFRTVFELCFSLSSYPSSCRAVRCDASLRTWDSRMLISCCRRAVHGLVTTSDK